MGAAFLIALREGLEAALIVGIILAVLRRLEQPVYRGAVWAGVAAAAVLSVLGAMGLNALGLVLEGRTEAIFEGATMLLAAGILTWVIFWMQRQGREIRVGLEAEVRRVVSEEDRWLLFVLSFVAVLREGLEMALFLTAASFQVETGQIWFGALLGLMVAIGLGWLFLAVGKGLNLRLFFRITSLVLLLFAAGLVGRGIHELQESGMIPTLIEHLWDINPFLDEKGPLGSFLQSLLGYNGNPSLLEVVAYILYLGTVSLLGCRQAADGALRLRT